jgi:hypothetical protein
VSAALTRDALAGLLQADWNIVKRGWDAHVLGKAPFKFTDPVEAIRSLRVRRLPALLMAQGRISTAFTLQLLLCRLCSMRHQPAVAATALSRRTSPAAVQLAALGKQEAALAITISGLIVLSQWWCVLLLSCPAGSL